MNTLVVTGWVFLAVVWGTTWAAIRIGLETLPPLTFAGVRFGAAGALLLAVLHVQGRNHPRGFRSWWLVGWTGGIIITLQYALQFWAQQYVASGLASVLMATIPVFVMVFAHWWLPSERLTIRRGVGALLGLAGVVAIFSDQLSTVGTLAFIGSVALVVGAGSSSAAQVMIKRSGDMVDPMSLAAWQMTLGAVPLLVLGLVLEGEPAAGAWTIRAVLAVGYLVVVGSAIAFFVMYWLIGRISVTKVLSVAFANPLVAVMIGWVAFGETLSRAAFLGAGAILTGLAMVLGLDRSAVRWRPGRRRSTES